MSETKTLDPQVKALISQMQQRAGKPLNEYAPVEARKIAHPLSSKMGGPPEDVAEVKNMKIPGPGADIPIRIYTPQGSVVHFPF